jgi:hypothetical protein
VLCLASDQPKKHHHHHHHHHEANTSDSLDKLIKEIAASDYNTATLKYKINEKVIEKVTQDQGSTEFHSVCDKNQ